MIFTFSLYIYIYITTYHYIAAPSPSPWPHGPVSEAGPSSDRRLRWDVPCCHSVMNFGLHWASPGKMVGFTILNRLNLVKLGSIYISDFWVLTSGIW